MLNKLQIISIIVALLSTF